MSSYFSYLHFPRKDLSYEETEESAAYDFSDLIGDIGGQTGLYLGFCILSVIEFFEVGINLLICAFCAAWTRVRIRNIKSADMEVY